MGKPEDFFAAAVQKERVEASQDSVKGAAISKAKELGIEVTEDMGIGEINSRIMAALDDLQAKKEQAPEPEPKPAPKKRMTNDDIAREATRRVDSKVKQQSFA